jgi:hypothetical protein
MQGLTLYQPPRLLPPFLEAAGAKSGHPEDASAGMPKWTDASNQKWAFNAVMGEWQIPHTIRSGDTLWNLSGLYYGNKSLGGVHAIHGVPQNLKIQGPSADSGLIPGDVILIPGLSQPSQAPAASDATPGSVPQVPVLSPPIPTPAGSPMPFPVPSTIPASWPTDLGYPPNTGGPSPTGADVVLTSSGGGTHPTVLPTVDVHGNVGPQKDQFWTGGRIAIAAGVGVVGLGTVAYLATRKKRRRR